MRAEMIHYKPYGAHGWYIRVTFPSGHVLESPYGMALDHQGLVDAIQENFGIIVQGVPD